MGSQALTGQPLGEKPAALATVYGKDGSAIKVHPCDAKELLAQADGFYSSTPAAVVAEAPVSTTEAAAAVDEPKRGRGAK